MQPINYMTDVLSPVEGFLNGIQFGEGINSARLNQDATRQNMTIQREQMDMVRAQFEMQRQQMAAQRAAVAAQQARAEAASGRLLQFAQSVEDGTANPADLRQAIAEFPEFTEQLQSTWNSVSEERQANELRFGQQLTFALANDNIGAAENLLRTRRDAAEAAGDAQGVAVNEAMLLELESNPRGLLTQTLMPMAAVMPVDDFDKYVNDVLRLGGGEEPESVRALRIRAQEAGLQPGTPEYQAFMSEGGRGPLVQIEGDQVDTRPITSAPAKDFQRVWDEEAQTFRDVVIPGSETAIAMESEDAAGASKDTQGQLMLGTTLTSLNLNINEIEDGGLPVTGAIGEARRSFLGSLVSGSEARDFANRSSQITDSAALAEIQRMRDNSPTGAAVGQLTDGERIAIGNAITALNAAGSAEEYVRAAKAYRELALNLAYGEGMWRLNDDGSVTAVGSVDSGQRQPAPAAQGQATPAPAGRTLTFNPATGGFE